MYKEVGFQLSSLLPNWSSITTPDFSTNETISAYVVLFLLLVLCFSVVMTFLSYWRARSRTNFYKMQLIKINKDELLQVHRKLTRDLSSDEKHGKLWREFHESLVFVDTENKLYNTIDAAHFFNNHSLAKGLTENRLTAAVPGFLTAIGVIGTFAGLQLGLSSLTGQIHLGDGETANVNELTSGIFAMIGGASIAFMTSVWGVATSVTFNFIEKYLERLIRNNISELQNVVDYLYPRITAEQTLSNLEGHSRSSNQILATLDEKIGDRLQEAMGRATESIQSGLEASLAKVLGPAIEKLVDNAHSGSEKALEGLMEQFLSKMGNVGASQKELLESTIYELNNSSGQITEAFKKLMGQLQHDMTQLTQQNSELVSRVRLEILQMIDDQREIDKQRNDQAKTEIETLQEQNKKLLEATQSEIMGILSAARQREQETGDQTKQHINAIAQTSKEMLENASRDITGVLTAQNDSVAQKLEGFTAQLQTMAKMYDQINKAIEQQSNDHFSNNRELAQRLSTLSDSFNDIAERNATAVAALDKTSTNLNHSAISFERVGERISNTTSQLSESITGATNKLIEMQQQLVDAGSSQNQLIVGLDEIRQRMTQTAEALNQAANRADSGFSSVNQHFNQLGESLKKHVSDLESQIASLLTGYSQQVTNQTNDRLNEWNQQTASYISAMTSAVNSVGSVVDEIDSKIQR